MTPARNAFHRRTRPAVAAVLALVAFGGTTGQGAEALPEAWLDDADLHAVHFADPDTGWAVGDRGVIWHTSDGGEHWQRQSCPGDFPLYDVCFVDRHSGWIVGAEYPPTLGTSRAVVLRTRDGGRRWERLPQWLLPGLRRCGFHDQTHGWAVGESSSVHPTGVFFTEDGGASWRAAAGPATAGWTSAVLAADRSGIVANEAGEIARTAEGSLRLLSPPRSAGISALGQLDGMLLAGDRAGGVYLADPGFRQVRELALPFGSAARSVRWLATAFSQGHAWLAGSPGSVVVRVSADGRPEPFATGSPLPIEDLAFPDANTGYAVGALGQILKTSDGGRSWRPVRSVGNAPRRLAVLGVFLTPQEIPLERLIRLAAAEHLRVGVMVVGHPQDADHRAASDRLHDGLISAGCAAGWIEPQVRLPPSGIDLPTSLVLASGGDGDHGQEVVQLVSELSRTIRTWRPGVVIVGNGRRPGDRLLQTAVTAAAELAADPLPSAARGLALRPWSVERLYQLEPRRDPGPEASAIVPALGSTTRGLADQVRARLRGPWPDLPADRLALIPPKDVEPQIGARHRLMDRQIGARHRLADKNLVGGTNRHGSKSVPGTDRQDSRRKGGFLGWAELLVPGTDLDARRAATGGSADRAQHELLVEQLVDRAGTAPATLAQITQLTNGMAPASAARLLLEAGTAQARGGQATAAADMFWSLLRSYPDQPWCWPAVQWLLGYYSSAEFAVRYPENRPTGRQRWEELAQMARQQWPQAAAAPEHRLLIAAGWRRWGDMAQAQRLYRQVGTTTSQDGHCRKLALAELALSGADSPLEAPCIAVPTTDHRPRLDGDLTDDLWASAARISLEAAPREMPFPASRVMVARDDQFLFLAAICPHSSDSLDVPSSPPTRDPADSLGDRLRLIIDVDRDAQTYWLLEASPHGSVMDALNDDRTWNPEWYIATGRTEEHWTLEAAIAISSLAPTSDGAGPWRVAVARIIPGCALPCWPAGGTLDADPLRGGYWVFD